ncbi:MAG: hypothetical protein F9K40_12270 [Kofleriaceae bacterium]|nr:MAG: hypothetical protein F9K40_12270 [Kofleriaceae bacterium]MBZ0230885.1 hypothetical protein [Kofleriaceae bacterium]
MVRSSLVMAALGLTFAGCGGGGGGGDVDAADLTDAAVDASVIPLLRNPVSTPDLELAQQATALLGVGGAKNCDRCHALSRDRLRSWDSESNATETACLTNLAPTTPAEAAAIVDCLRAEPGVVTSGWPPHKLGIYNTAARLDWFRYVFQLAHGSTWEDELELFTGEAAMPRGDAGQLTQAEFDIVAEWFARGLPQLDAVVPADPPPTQCTTTISAEVATHVNTMRTEGWRAINEERGINMFGCQGASDARGCLADFPRAGAADHSMGWEDAEPTAAIRILRENTYASSYWTRSSADGRYVSHGGAPVASSTYRSSVIDLQTGVNIPAAALYDPGFFPDNSGFALQGGGSQAARFCEQSMLSPNPAMITFSEPQCRRTGAVGLYQHLAAANGGDYWTVDGQFDNDNGGQINSNNPTLTDTSATFSSDADVDLTPMVHTGTQFVPQAGIEVTLPREGDVIISPSARLLVSRVSGANGSQAGFILRKLVATKSGASYTVNTPEIARYCLRGGKPAISFDERWMVFHHYVEASDWQALGYASADDPGFLALRDAQTGGAANIFLMELTTGDVRRITTMQPGQYALYPHFRSDGWIYFIVRDRNRNFEWIAASDAALVFE